MINLQTWRIIALSGILFLLESECFSEDILIRNSHKNYFNLDQMVDKADGIYVVRKAHPFVTVKKRYYDDNPGKYPAHENRSYHFIVVRTLKDSSRVKDSAITVDDAYSDLSYTMYCFYYVKHVIMEPLVGFYRSSISMDRKDTVIVFVDRPDKKNDIAVRREYVFSVVNAFESAALTDSVVSIMQRLKRPPKSLQQVMIAKEKMRAETRAATGSSAK